MSKKADFYFDYGSPTSYLAYMQMPGVVERTGAKITYKPILLGGILQATNNASPMDIAAKRKWMLNDIQYFAKRYDVEFAFNPHFPINTLNLMRGAIYAQKENFLIPYSDAIYKAMWVDGKNMTDPAVIKQVLTEAGVDAEKLFAATQDPSVKEALKHETQAAVDLGLFGAPALVIGDMLFFGQDRIPYAEEALACTEVE